MPDVWFIRHAECTANVGGATRTAEEAHLTARGREQAQLVADYLRNAADHKLTRIITSSSERTRKTAQSTRNYFGEVRLQTWKSVKEFSYLALANDVPTTKADRLPLVRDYCRRCNPSFKHGDKAESFNAFISRVQSVLKELCKCEDDEIIVTFSHHQFIQAVKWLLENRVERVHLQPAEMHSFYQILKQSPIPNGAILKTRLNPREQTILSWEVSHLPNNTPPTDIHLTNAARSKFEPKISVDQCVAVIEKSSVT